MGNVAGRPGEPLTRDRLRDLGGPPGGAPSWPGGLLAGLKGGRARGAPEVTEALGVSAADPGWAPRSTCTARRGPQGSSLPSTTPVAEKHG